MTKPKAKNVFPPGWDERKVQELIAHHEGQTDEEAAVEDDSAFSDRSFTIMQIPVKLVPEVDELLVRRSSARPPARGGRDNVGSSRSGGRTRTGRAAAGGRG